MDLNLHSESSTDHVGGRAPNCRAQQRAAQLAWIANRFGPGLGVAAVPVPRGTSRAATHSAFLIATSVAFVRHCACCRWQNIQFNKGFESLSASAGAGAAAAAATAEWLIAATEAPLKHDATGVVRLLLFDRLKPGPPSREFGCVDRDIFSLLEHELCRHIFKLLFLVADKSACCPSFRNCP